MKFRLGYARRFMKCRYYFRETQATNLLYRAYSILSNSYKGHYILLINLQQVQMLMKYHTPSNTQMPRVVFQLLLKAMHFHALTCPVELNYLNLLP